MKNIKFFLLSLIAVTLLFSACSDLSKDSSDSQKKSQYTVLGSLSFAGVSRAVYSRTATTAFSDEPVWTISATKGEKSYLPNEVSDLAFNFTFDEAGEYLIEATALKAGKIIAQGSCLCMVSEDEENFASIIAKPVASILPGSVNLEINLDSYSANKVSSVQVEWLGFVNIDRTKQDLGYPAESELTGDEKEPEISEEVQAAIAALIDWEEQRSEGEFNTTVPVESGKAVIEMGNIFCGAHTVKLSFNDSVGNILYSCKEILNVYSGFTTNEWYGTAPYLNNGTFTLISTLVEKYGAELVPSTNYVLYNYEQGGPEVNGEKKYNYYFVSGNDLENPLSSPAVTSLAVGDSSSIIDARCFDSEGNLYLLQMSYDYQNDMALQSTKTDWTAPNMIEKLGINYGYERNLAITSDFKTNKFYIFVIDQDADTTISVNCYPDILSSNGSTTTKLSKSLDFGGGSISSYYFAVNNDNLYMLSTSQGVSNPYTLRVYDLSLLSGEASSINYSNSISLDLLSILGVDEIKGEISDMLYQDGCLYMLYKEVSDYNADPDVYSRGGVIQYNLLTGSTLFKGFTTNYIARDSGYSLQAMTKDTYGNQYFLYMDASGNEPFVPEVNKAEQYPDIYVPGENESSFYGPTKFIAIKPKQLVISDEGFAYYTNNGLLYRKNVNRVAIVNLEDFAMEVKNINPSLSMEENYTGNLMNRGSVGLEAGDVYYKKDGDNYTAFSSDCCYLSVITEE